MTGHRDTPAEITIDESGSSINGDMANNDPPTNSPQEEEDDSEDPDEYSVEAIRSKRKNKETGVDEYLIKWVGYPESDNTWEPLENLKCPDLIAKFNEQEANKKRRKKAERTASSSASTQAKKRPRRDAASNASTQGSEDTTNDDANSLFLEDDDDDIESSTRKTSQSSRNNQQSTNDQVALKGFQRGLPIEEIISAGVGDDNTLYFFVKWQGRTEIDMVEVEELEKNGSYELCRWYRDRLAWDQKYHPNHSSTAFN